MKTSYKCIECFFRQIEKTTSFVKISKKNKEKLFLLLTRKLLNFDFNQPPVAFGRTIYKTISRISKVKDPFLKEKVKIERNLLKFSSSIERILKNTKDPLGKAAEMACCANSIDFGAGKSPDLKNLLAQINKKTKLLVNHFDKFKRKLRKAKIILFIGDNCGEAFFDFFFIKQIKYAKPNIEIFYATRSSPIINDILISDARRIGLNRMAKVISSGCDYPGLILSKTSNQFRKIYRKADLIISKGQGNFESLEDKKDIFYLFKIKCPAVSDFLKLPVESLLFLYPERYSSLRKERVKRRTTWEEFKAPSLPTACLSADRAGRQVF